MFRRTAQFLLLESLSGLILSGIALSYGMANRLKQAVAERVGLLFDSQTIQTLDERLSAV